MPKFEIKVPYREMVYGTIEYHIEAEDRDAALKELDRMSYMYRYDSEIYESEHYEEFWDDAEWEELK